MCPSLRSAAPAALLLALGVAAPARADALLPPGWGNRLQVGLTDGPGGAAALQRSTPMRLRYQYLAGGVNTGDGWSTWNPDGAFASMYVKESIDHGITPVFDYYMIRQSEPGKDDSDEAHAVLG